MAPVIFPEKDFSRIFSDVHGYDTVFLDRIRERQWYGLVYDNIDLDTYYCPDLVKKICMGINVAAIDHDHFVVHLDHGDLEVTWVTIEEATQIPSSPQHTAPLPLIDYMTLMGVRCTELDHGVRENTTFRNSHCVNVGSNAIFWVLIIQLLSTDQHFKLFTAS